MAKVSQKHRLPLVLSAKRATWRLADGDHASADAGLQEIRPAVLKRDKYSCKFCTFTAPKWQEVHHLDDDHTNNAPENLATACIFCHMCFHIGRAGMMGEAILIFCPEISQPALNNLARTLFIGIAHEDGAAASGSRIIFDTLKSRATDAKERLGTSDPSVLGATLLKLTDEEYAARDARLKGIRLLPLGKKMINNEDRFPKIVDYWTSQRGPYAGLPPEAWPKIFTQHKTALFGTEELYV